MELKRDINESRLFDHVYLIYRLHRSAGWMRNFILAPYYGPILEINQKKKKKMILTSEINSF